MRYLSDSLKTFVDEQVSQRGCDTRSEYVCELIRKDQQGQELRGLLLDGASSASAGLADTAHFKRFRRRVEGFIA